MKISYEGEARTKKTSSYEEYEFSVKKGVRKNKWKSKEIQVSPMKITYFPFFVNNEGDISKKPNTPEKIIFENIKESKLPAGFSKKVKTKSGYGFTPSGNRLKNFIASNITGIKCLVISGDKKTKKTKDELIINIEDFQTLWKNISKIKTRGVTEQKNLIANFFNNKIQTTVSKKSVPFSPGSLSNFVQNFKSIKLSDTDILAIDTIIGGISSKNIQSIAKTKALFEKKEIELVLETFKEKLSKKSILEEEWQLFFQENSWIFSQILAFPAILIQDKPYFGGKDISGTGGSFGDFVYQNNITKNVALIEIKTHVTPIMGVKKYREPNIYGISEQLSGTISQILHQKDKLSKHLSSLLLAETDQQKKTSFSVFNPKCLIIIGKAENLGDKINSFELFRNTNKDVEIFTFDELFSKIESILKIFRTIAD